MGGVNTGVPRRADSFHNETYCLAHWFPRSKLRNNVGFRTALKAAMRKVPRLFLAEALVDS
jgi:hypothetical protein